MHRADRSPTDPSQECTSGIGTLQQPEGARLCPMGEAVSVSQVRLDRCTPAQWDAIEARAVACMRAQLVRYHRGGGMEQAADWERAKTAWALIVMNRERITRGGAA